jgi:hypothetical protein
MTAIAPLTPTAAQLDAMVDRFLTWRLPDDFYPDCGISFTKLNHPNSWPVGTNLLTAEQAKAMLLHVLGAPSGGPELLECCAKALAAWEGTGPAIVLDELRAAIAKATGAAAPPQPAEPPPGWKLVLVNDAFDKLMDALIRAEQKDYMPDAMADEWDEFRWKDATLTDEQIQKLEFHRWVREIATGPTPTAGTDEAPRRRNDDNWQDYDQHPAAPKPHGPVSEQFMRHHYGAKK